MYNIDGIPMCTLEIDAMYEFLGRTDNFALGETIEDIQRLTKMSLAVFVTCHNSYTIAIDSRVLNSNLTIKSDEEEKFLWLYNKNILVTSCGTNEYEKNDGQSISWKTIIQEATKNAESYDSMPVAISNYMWGHHYRNNEFMFINIKENKISIIQQDSIVLDYSIPNLYHRAFKQGMSMVSVPEFLCYTNKKGWPATFEHAIEQIVDYFQFSRKVFELTKKEYDLKFDCPFGGKIHFFNISYDGEINEFQCDF